MIISIQVYVKMFSLHARKDCGCFFSAPLWEERKKMNGKTSWMCTVDPERVKAAHPDQYDAVCKDNPGFNIKFPTCNEKYYPFKHGPGALFEVKVGDEWWPIVSELWPEELTNAFEKAQASWYSVHKGTDAMALQLSVQQSATKPNTCIVPGVPLQCVGKFPLAQFYADGNKALKQQDWVSYFLETSAGHDNDVLDQFSRVCLQWLRKKQLPAPVMLDEDQRVRSAPMPNMGDDEDIHGHGRDESSDSDEDIQ